MVDSGKDKEKEGTFLAQTSVVCRYSGVQDFVRRNNSVAYLVLNVLSILYYETSFRYLPSFSKFLIPNALPNLVIYF